MAKKQAVWGIDIGNSSLKAMRCCVADEPGKVEVLSCDFIEHSKVLSQPDTNVAEVLAETLQIFFSRNHVKGDRVAVAVSGQNTISRFLKLPPVDPKKIPDVIKYEARQWLPFALSEVVWDFQPLGADANEPTDMLLDATVGMFAIKKDLAMKTLLPYTSRSIDVDMIQSSPMALYNYVTFDQLNELGAAGAFDNEEQELVVTLCIGTDASDVVITNGQSIWTRNIPIGGGSFTKMLAKNLQLTYSKAEYVKRNIGTAPDQQSVIQAMRSSFNDTVNEVNRSLEYYQTLNRKAQFKKILVTGNAGKLLGLRQYLAQNLGYEVERITSYNRLTGLEVLESQQFKENLPSFSICYGLVVQQLALASLKTNLIPREIVTDRIIREKKPWALAAAAAVLLGLTVHFASATSVLQRVQNSAYDAAGNKVQQLETTDKKFRDDTEAAKTDFNAVDSIGKTLTSSVEGRITWLELLHVINAALPKDGGQDGGDENKADKLTSESIAKENKVYVTSIDAVPVSSLAKWFAPLKGALRYIPDKTEFEVLIKSGVPIPTVGVSLDNAAVDADADTPTPGTRLPAAAKPQLGGGAPAEEGQEEVKAYENIEADILAAMAPGPVDVPESKMRVVQITGYHYHNPQDTEAAKKDGGAAYLRKTLLHNLKHGTVVFPSSGEAVTMEELGVSYPVLLYTPDVRIVRTLHPELQALVDAGTIANTGTNAGNRGARAGRGGRDDENDRVGMYGGKPGAVPDENSLEAIAKKMGIQENVLTLRRFDFVIQFAWMETPPSVRTKKKENEATNASRNTGQGDVPQTGDQ
ncbi:MAG: pilus assembly protein PilM [Planctomycetaceae bacterium]|jgi:type IV pilus assembly protein PilM|nr:pilus assembly protein PilM [Planctomycetaceae bacterium]